MGAALPVWTFALLSLITVVRAVVEDSSPCSGQGCSWNIESQHSRGKTQATFRMNGAPGAISDLTAAAGWTILDCDAGVKAQTIRAVCTGSRVDCDQLHEGGAEHTLVRLPENCGNGLFARVVSEKAHEDQTLPDNVRKQLRSRSLSPSVRAITVDTRFDEVDPSVHGPVAFSIDGKTVLPTNNVSSPSRDLSAHQELASSVSFVPSPMPNSSVVSRSAFASSSRIVSRSASASSSSVVSRSAFTSSSSFVSTPALSSSFVSRPAPAPSSSFVSGPASASSSSFALLPSGTPNTTNVGLGNPTAFDETLSSTLHINERHEANPVEETIRCGDSANSSLTGDVIFKALTTGSIDMEYGVEVAGTIIPKNFKKFDLFARFNASFDLEFAVDLMAEVMISTGNATFQEGLPGISIPDVFELGPFFQISGNFNASAVADASLSFESRYNIKNAELIFPPSSGASSGLFQQAGSVFQFGFNKNISSVGTVQLEIIPAILFGVSLFDGAEQATVGLNVVGQGSMNFNVSSNSPDCVALTTGIAVTADAEGKISGIIDKDLSFTIFEDQFDVFKGICPANTSVSNVLPRTHTHTDRSLGLGCITGDQGGARSLIRTPSIPAGPFIPSNSSTST